jgi:prepilin-type N-terminal cleavage/methylation domain-containing protein
MVVETAIPLFYARNQTMPQRGFTMLEMIAVIAIVGILSIFAAASFNRTAFDMARYARELEATLAYAQKSAVAQRRAVTVTVAAGSVSFAICSTFNPCGGTVPLQIPTQTAGTQLTAPSGVTLASTAASFSFTTAGGTDQAAAVTVTVSGDGSRTIVVEPGTGYVHPG